MAYLDTSRLLNLQVFHKLIRVWTQQKTFRKTCHMELLLSFFRTDELWHSLYCVKFLVANFSITTELHNLMVNLLLVPKLSLKLPLGALHSLRDCPLASYQRRYFPAELISPHCLPVACIMPPRKAGRRRRSIFQMCWYRQSTCSTKKVVTD